MGNFKMDITALCNVTIADLRRRYVELFGTEANSSNRKYLKRKIAYQIQEIASGSLAEVVKNRIDELIKAYDPINKIPVKSGAGKTSAGRDARLPMPGSFITKTYKGKRLEVNVLEDGFEYQGSVYKNLSAVAKAITGAHWNGFIFFGVKNNGRRN